MGSLLLVRSLLACCALLCSMQACAYDGCEGLLDNDIEAWARRTYFYVGGQYVKTTLVCSLSSVDPRQR